MGGVDCGYEDGAVCDDVCSCSLDDVFLVDLFGCDVELVVGLGCLFLVGPLFDVFLYEFDVVVLGFEFGVEPCGCGAFAASWSAVDADSHGFIYRRRGPPLPRARSPSGAVFVFCGACMRFGLEGC